MLWQGVRISHGDFGGRALSGWSAQCQTGSESGCGSDWIYGVRLHAISSVHPARWWYHPSCPLLVL
eukprot:2161454-Prymnesium_polylepis.2